MGQIIASLSWVFSGNMAARIFAAVVQIMLARKLGAGTFGVLTAAQAVANIATIVAEWGLSNLQLRRAALESGDEAGELKAVILLKLKLFLVVYAGLWGIVSLMGYGSDIKQTVLVVGLTIPLTGLINAISTYHQVRKNLRMVGLIQVLAAALNVVFVLAVIVLSTSSAVIVAWASVASLALTVVVLGWPLVPQLAAAETPVGSWPLLRGAWPFALSTFFYIVYTNMDAVLLSVLRKPEDVGAYTAAFRLMAVVLLLCSTVSTTLLPHFYSYLREDRGNPARLGRASALLTKYLAAVGVPLSLGLALVSRDVIALLYGAPFAQSALALAILAPSIAIRVIGLAATECATVLDWQWTRTSIHGAAALANVAANLILIPRFNFYGAAAANLVSESLLAIAFLVLSRRLFNGKVLLLSAGDVARVGAASLAMAMTYYLIAHWLLPVKILITAAVYGGVLVGTGFVTAMDRRLVRQRFQLPSMQSADEA